MKRIWTGCLLALLIPYVVTLVWNGSLRGEQKPASVASGKRVLLDGGSGGYVDVEEYLIGVVGRQIPPDYGEEALKAQAVAARTQIYKKLGSSDEIKESELGMDMDCMEESKLEKLWGSEKYVEYYQSIKDAVDATAGRVILYGDEEIDALFHRASAGVTRAGDEFHPYLVSVDSRRDVEAPDCMTVTNWTLEEFTAKIKELGKDQELSAKSVPEAIQLIERDGGGYVGKMMIGSYTYTGEELQKALGFSSCCFTLEGYEGGIRGVCKGIGHGYGLSQYGAKGMAEDGYTWEDILNYYYKDITIYSPGK